MQIPNCERAIVDIVKLRDYCLNLDHIRGRHKARVFLNVLGLTVNDAGFLHEELLKAACNDGAVIGERDEFGQRYRLDFAVAVNEKKAIVRSLWIIRSLEDVPRLTSCYVL
jgi:hypothetical protein